MEEHTNFAVLVREELIFLRVGGDAAAALRTVADALQEKGVVLPTYYEALMEREHEFPTGLPMGELNIAMPHTVPQHTLKKGVAIATLAKPALFRCMGDADSTVQVQLLVFPLLDKMDDNVRLLPSLIHFFIKQENIRALLEAESPAQIMAILRERAESA